MPKPNTAEFGKKGRPGRELILISVMTLVFFFLSARWGLADWYHEATRPWARFGIDELPMVAVFLLFAVAAFAARRWYQAAEYELEARIQYQALLDAMAEVRELRQQADGKPSQPPEASSSTTT